MGEAGLGEQIGQRLTTPEFNMTTGPENSERRTDELKH